VPVGWNKPADQMKRWTCCEVVKTCEREAARLEARLSRIIDYGAVRDRNLRSSRVPSPVRARVKPLKSAEANKRMVNFRV
jgi:hypothetical protein